MKIKRFQGDFIVYGIVAIVCIVLDILLFFVDSVHAKAIDYVQYLAGLIILAYVGIYLVPRLLRKREAVIRTIMIVECAFVGILGVCMFIPDKEVISDISRAFGLVIYIRGVVEIIRGFRSQGDIIDKDSKFHKLAKYIDIAFITLGTYLFFQRPLTNERVVIVIEILLIAIAVFGVVFAIRFFPKNKEEVTVAKPAEQIIEKPVEEVKLTKEDKKALKQAKKEEKKNQDKQEENEETI